MKHLLIIAFALALLPVSSFAGQPGDTTSTTIPFHLRANCSLIVITCKVNGINASFLFDTGSEISVLDQSQAATFHFDVVENDDPDSKNTGWGGIGGTSKLNYADHVLVQLGSIQLKNCFKCADLDAVLSAVSNRTGRNVVGIIGADILSKYHLIIDFTTNSIHQ